MTTRRVALTSTALLVLALSACASSPGTDGPPSRDAATSSLASPTDASIDTASPDATAGAHSDPDLVVDQVTATYWASDASTDTTPLDAARRAAQWLTTEHNDLIAEDLPSGPGADWLTLDEHQAKYVVTSIDATAAMTDLPPDTPTTASRARVVELTPAGSDGWVGDKTTLVVRFDLTRPSTDTPWLVDTITASEPIGMPSDESHDGH